MKKKKRRRKKSVNRGTDKSPVVTLASFIAQANANSIGRSPSVLPFAEELLMRTTSDLNSGMKSGMNLDKRLSATDFVQHREPSASHDTVNALASESSVSVATAVPLGQETSSSSRVKVPARQPLWWVAIAVPMLFAFYLIAIFMSQSTSQIPTQLAHIQTSKSAAPDGEFRFMFEREMESGAIFEKLGDNEQALSCYQKAAALPHDTNQDKQNLLNALNRVTKSAKIETHKSPIHIKCVQTKKRRM